MADAHKMLLHVLKGTQIFMRKRQVLSDKVRRHLLQRSKIGEA